MLKKQQAIRLKNVNVKKNVTNINAQPDTTPKHVVTMIKRTLYCSFDIMDA